jgi:hypothetical protein
MRLLGALNHDECAPWCDHEPMNHETDCSDAYCDGYTCWKTTGIERPFDTFSKYQQESILARKKCQ